MSVRSSNSTTTLRIAPYSVRMRENTDQNNYEYGHFSRSDSAQVKIISVLWYNRKHICHFE